MEIFTEASGRYTHYFIKKETLALGDRLYIGLSTAHYDYSITGQYRPSAVLTIIDFARAFYASDQSAFLPDQIIVANEKVPEFIKRAAEWYASEYDLYQAGMGVM